jgi:hypothetical protein
MMVVSGPDFDTGEIAETTIIVPLAEGADSAARLQSAGLTLIIEDGRAIIEEPFPGTPYFESLGKAFDYYGDEPVQIGEVRKETDRIFKEVVYFPALLLLAVVVLMQKVRARKEGGGTSAAAA